MASEPATQAQTPELEPIQIERIAQATAGLSEILVDILGE